MAKILHTSDWHIDRMTGRISRQEDLETALREVVQQAKTHNPDLILHTGDLFQGVRPSTEGMKLAFEALQELAAIAPVVVVCGNHDSPALYELFSQILGEQKRIQFVSKVKSPSEGGIITIPARDGERIKLASLPFIHANRVVGERAFGRSEDWTTEYAEYIGKIEKMLAVGLQRERDPKRDVLIFAAHLHVSGAQFSGSERGIHVSEAYGSKIETLPGVAYAAFGHLHKPQALPGLVPGRFAGSPIQLDFGEVEEEKGSVLIEAHPSGKTEITILPLTKSRRLLKLRGTLADLATRKVRNEIIKVTVETKRHEPQLAALVAELFSKATVAEITEISEERILTVAEFKEEEVEIGFREMFQEFLKEQENLKGSANAVMENFSRMLSQVEEGGTELFPEEIDETL